MKNKDFFYKQYDKINWEKQKETKINQLVNDYIIENLLSKYDGDELKLFDIGFGIGFFINMTYDKLKKSYNEILIEGCEPSLKNYNFFKTKNSENIIKDVKVFPKTFLNMETSSKFSFITAIYVFPHFLSKNLIEVVEKINFMLEKKGKFVMVVANEKYLENKLNSEKSLFIEKNIIEYNNSKYNEVLHYSEIPEIGTLIDYNREEKYYLDLFQNNNFKLIKKENLDDNGFIATIFVFEKVK
jgi:hypothetical protein